MSDEFIGLAKLNGGRWLASRPQPRHAAADDYEKDDEEEEFDEAAHLIMILPVVTFLGSADGAVSSNG